MSIARNAAYYVPTIKDIHGVECSKARLIRERFRKLRSSNDRLTRVTINHPAADLTSSTTRGSSCLYIGIDPVAFIIEIGGYLCCCIGVINDVVMQGEHPSSLTVAQLKDPKTAVQLVPLLFGPPAGETSDEVFDLVCSSGRGDSLGRMPGSSVVPVDMVLSRDRMVYPLLQ